MATTALKLRPRDRARSDRQRQLRARWEDARWWAIGALFVLALVLGFLGFQDYQSTVGGPDGFWDVLYRDLQLYVFESGALPVASAIPFSLQVARLLAPAATLLFVQQAVAPLFRDQLQILRSERRREHAVVCGLGDRGLEVARNLRERGHRVVAVEQDEEHGHVSICRAAGVPVIVGDATDAAVLRKAGTGGAALLVAVCGDDAVNAKIVAGAEELAIGRDEPLDCLAHIYDGQLCSLLRADVPTASGGSSLRLDFFNTFESGAQALLLRHPPFPDRDQPERPHLLVVGLGWLGASLIEQAARHWHATAQGGLGRLRITVVDIKADSEVVSLLARHPQVDDVCDLVPVSVDVRSGEFTSGGFMAPDAPAVTAAYVCLEDDGLTLATGLALNRLLDPEVTIVMRALTDAGLPALFEGPDQGEFEHLHAFPLIDRVCDPDLLFGGDDEIIARGLHDVYCDERQADGWHFGPEYDDEAMTNPALAHWDDLDEEFRASNRDQAAHTGAKLEAVGCRLEDSVVWEVPISFSEDEVEVLAEMEHERWNRDQERHGWTYGQEKDRPNRRTPYLVPWSELPDNIREYDREFVRELPILLAKLGFSIVRDPSSEPSSPI